MIFRTSRGDQPRGVQPLRGTRVTVHLNVEPGDEVVVALLRGERVTGRFCPDCPAWIIGGSDLPGLLPRLLAQCAANPA